MDPWEQMDAWLRARAEAVRDRFENRIEAENYNTDHPELRRLLGQSQMIGRMRSFIHGARTRP